MVHSDAQAPSKQVCTISCMIICPRMIRDLRHCRRSVEAHVSLSFLASPARHITGLYCNSPFLSWYLNQAQPPEQSSMRKSQPAVLQRQRSLYFHRLLSLTSASASDSFIQHQPVQIMLDAQEPQSVVCLFGFGQHNPLLLPAAAAAAGCVCIDLIDAAVDPSRVRPHRLGYL